MCVNEICIPKMSVQVTDKIIKEGIEKQKIGRIKRYTEIAWKNDPTVKRILMTLEWNTKHSQYSQIQERLSNGQNIKIVNNMDIWHIYKRGNLGSPLPSPEGG